MCVSVEFLRTDSLLPDPACICLQIQNIELYKYFVHAILCFTLYSLNNSSSRAANKIFWEAIGGERELGVRMFCIFCHLGPNVLL